MAEKGRLVKIKNKPRYYRHSVNGIIYYRDDRSEIIALNGGRQIKKSTGSSKIREAEEFIEKELATLRGESEVEFNRRKKNIKNPQLKDLWDDMVSAREHGAAPQTVQKYRSNWEIGMEPFWGSLHLSDVNQNKVVEFEKWYLQNFESRVFFNTRKYLKMFFNYLKENGFIQRSPEIKDLDSVLAKQNKKKEVGRVYTAKELGSLIEASFELEGQDPAYTKVRLGIFFAVRMGLRLNEFLSIKWADINLSKKTVKVWRKNKYWATLILPNSLVTELKSYQPQWKSEEFLFFSDRKIGSRVTAQAFDRWWIRVKEKAGLKDGLKKYRARVHDLRHTFATHTARQNWNPVVACQYLDMSLKEYQETYVHVDAKMMSKLINLPSPEES